MSKQTLEEAAEKYAEKWNDLENQFKLSSCFIAGAKCQAERSYSDAIDLFITEIKNEFKDDNWDYLEFIKVRVIEQFKKK